MKAKFFIPFGILILILGAFQNCGPGLESNPISLGVALSSIQQDGSIPSLEDDSLVFRENDDPAPLETNDGPMEACMFNGELLYPGASVTAYARSSVPYGEKCVAQTRVCGANGLSGSAPYAGCQVGAPASCLHSGVTVAHGKSMVAYESSSVSYGQSCRSATLTCSNGTFSQSASGNFPFSKCEVGVAASCAYNGGTLQHGQSIMAHTKSTVPYGESCNAVNVSCYNGQLTNGSAVYANCSVQAPLVKWVNVNAQTTETHSQTCHRVGLFPAKDKGYGICAAGENRPSQGTDYQNIAYNYGAWGNSNTGGTQIVAGVGMYYCYSSGQKRDGDGSDILVAYLCSQEPNTQDTTPPLIVDPFPYWGGGQ